MSDGSLCLRPPHEGEHREPGPAPAALAQVVADLRHEVADARRIARELHRALPAAVRRDLDDGGWPWWLTTDNGAPTL